MWPPLHLLLHACASVGGSPPPRSLQSWLTCCGLGRTPDESTASLPHDVYAVGTQENPQGEREWAEHVRNSLRSATSIDYRQVRNGCFAQHSITKNYLLLLSPLSLTPPPKLLFDLLFPSFCFVRPPPATHTYVEYSGVVAR